MLVTHIKAEGTQTLSFIIKSFRMIKHLKQEIYCKIGMLK